VTKTTTLEYSPAGQHDRSDVALGLFCGIAAYASWGIFPVYFKLVGHVPAIVVLAHRIAWSALFLVIVISVQRRWDDLRECLRNRLTLRLLLCSTAAIAINWFVFIWAVTHERIIAASLGYFINPLISVLLGVIFLKEHLRLGQGVALIIAAGAVAAMVVLSGEVPTISVVIAVSFAAYALLRKLAVVAPTIGLLVETGILLPFSLLLIGRQAATTPTAHGTYALLSLSGLVTALPLLWFAAAARRLRLSTMGFLQYLSPTGQFLLGRLVYHEPLSASKLACYAAIWAALALFTIDSAVGYRKQRRALLPVALPD
jgi:chloramphenicol-sensitive protein RarD